MPKQTLVFDSKSDLSIKNGLLSIVREGKEEVFRAFEDIQTIIIDHHSVSVTIPLLNKLSENQIAVVFCNEKHYPQSLLMDFTNWEGVAANCYWKRLMGNSFIRDRYGEEPNNLLNYGYALLRSSMSRALMDSGLMPTLGVFHRSYYDSFPLADDIMEPYRPYVDRKVCELFVKGKRGVDKEVKVEMLELFYTSLKRDVLTKTTASLVNYNVPQN